MSAESVHAKRSEVKGPDLTSPDLTTEEPKTSSFIVAYVSRETATSDDARCCFPPCGEPKARGTYFCKEHGRQWSRASELTRRKTDPLERFRAVGWTERAVVEHLGPCWEWNGSRNSFGYGQFTMTGASSAHRAAYLFEHGSIPDGLHVLHECDNRACVNPAHLTTGTRSDNMTGMWDRRRHPTARLTDAQVLEVRRRYTGAWGEQTTLAREYGVSSNHINLIVRGLARRRTIAKEQASPARMMPGGAR